MRVDIVFSNHRAYLCGKFLAIGFKALHNAVVDIALDGDVDLHWNGAVRSGSHSFDGAVCVGRVQDRFAAAHHHKLRAFFADEGKTGLGRGCAAGISGEPAHAAARSNRIIVLYVSAESSEGGVSELGIRRLHGRQHSGCTINEALNGRTTGFRSFRAKIHVVNGGFEVSTDRVHSFREAGAEVCDVLGGFILFLAQLIPAFDHRGQFFIAGRSHAGNRIHAVGAAVCERTDHFGQALNITSPVTQAG